MQEKYPSQQQINKLLNKYITCLDMYFRVLHDACQQAKKSSALQYQIDNPSVEIMERFITIGKRIQYLLAKLQERNY